jgi:hypothetical protein
LILTAPTSLGLLLPSRSKVVALPAPLRLPEHAIQLLWHERFSNEPGHTWLREVLIAVTQRFAR